MIIFFIHCFTVRYPIWCQNSDRIIYKYHQHFGTVHTSSEFYWSWWGWVCHSLDCLFNLGSNDLSQVSSIATILFNMLSCSESYLLSSCRQLSIRRYFSFFDSMWGIHLADNFRIPKYCVNILWTDPWIIPNSYDISPHFSSRSAFNRVAIFSIMKLSVVSMFRPVLNWDAHLQTVLYGSVHSRLTYWKIQVAFSTQSFYFNICYFFFAR